MDFVAADLGASGTRYVTDQAKINVLPNNISIIDYDTTTNLEPNAEDIESNLELTIVKDGAPSNYFPVTLLAGQMARRHSMICEVPNMNSNKHVQRVNYYSAIMAVALGKIKFGLADDIFFLMDVPPVEIENARKAFREELTGKFTVTFPKYMGGTTVSFNIVGVEVYEESVMAMMSFFFNLNGVPKEENKQFMVGNVLSLDIGASTTDIIITENGKYNERSAYTIKAGGNVARTHFINSIAAIDGYDLPEADAERAIAEGRLVEGNGYRDVGDLVNKAKRELAAQLTNGINSYFVSKGFPIKLIKALILSGGGSMTGQYINEDGEVVNTSEPLSKFVTEEIQKLSPSTIAVSYGEDSRLANIKGLFIRAKVLMAKMAKDAVKVAPTPVAPVAPVTPVTPVTHAVQQVVNQTTPVI